MGDNFYSFLSRKNVSCKIEENLSNERQDECVCFDDIIDEVNVDSIESLRSAFDLYVKDYAPPCDITDILSDGRFSRDGDLIRIDFTIPFVSSNEDIERIKDYFHSFCKMCGIDENEDDVECLSSDNGRGSMDCEFSIVHKMKDSEN